MVIISTQVMTWWQISTNQQPTADNITDQLNQVISDKVHHGQVRKFPAEPEPATESDANSESRSQITATPIGIAACCDIVPKTAGKQHRPAVP